jgi:hypothetical protein
MAELPTEIAAALRSGGTCEFATVTAKGLPLDTPLLFEPGDGSVDVTTGLAYPTKAERARRNPKVGLLLELADGPVLSIAALAAVRDADIGANALRYARRNRELIPFLGGGRPWTELRNAVWYWARIYIECWPQRVAWWPDAASVDQPPTVWRADPGPVPSSDPAPQGPPSPAPAWPVTDWHSRADEVAAAGTVPHLTLVDPEGFPLPMRVKGCRRRPDGFDVETPAGAPWATEGTASLCFDGRATFAGRLDGTRFVVERKLPDLPLVTDPREIFDPRPEYREALLARMQAELARRHQPVPVLPTDAL